MNNLIASNKSGFTLMELVVSISIFSILSLVMVALYVAFSNSQWRTQAGQKTLNDAQYAMEVMAREIRNNAIYYDAAPACPPSEEFAICLRMEKADGTIIAFLANNWTNPIVYGVWDSVAGSWDYSELINLHKIIDVEFLLAPATDPFIFAGPNQQPQVTIKLIVQPDTQRNVEKVTYRLQTTVSSRVYRR